jgi:hypothetical protein
MAYKVKTWFDNLKEGILTFGIGLIFGPIGFGILKGMRDTDTAGAMIVNGIPLPLELFPLLLIAFGVGLLVMGLITIISTLYRRFVKKSIRYIRPK